MDVVGKYAFVGVLEIEAWTLLGTEPPRAASATRIITLGGRCQGDNGHGLWLTVDAVYNLDGSRMNPDASQAGQAVTFIPWSAIRSATLMTDPPPYGRLKLGFQGR